MGNKNPSCLKPQIDENNFDNNSEFQITNNQRRKYRNVFKKEEFHSFSNKSNSFYNRRNQVKKKPKTYLDKVKTIQKFVRYCLSIKKFNEHIDLLNNILELDSTVNVIKDKKIENNLLMNNKGEQLSIQLMNSKKLTNYKYTSFYRMNINKYKINRYLVKTPLTYIDKYKNNDLYVGTWTLEKKFLGYGIFYFSGNKYEGFWNLGKLYGEGRKFYENKDYYIGNLVDGCSNGFGKYYHSDGTIYEGNWQNDQPHGSGKELFTDGSKFVGIFEKGSKKSGKFTWVDGACYDGEIKNNFFEGYGRFKWKEGREYVGFWKNGKMHGKGIMSYLDGAKYEGEFFEGKRQGKGTYFWNKNKYYKGNWAKGKQEGNGYYYNKGKGIVGIWNNGTIKQCLSKEINQELLSSKINDERPIYSSDKYSKTMNGKSEYACDSINISTNLSNNSMRDIRNNKKTNKSENKKKEIKKKNPSNRVVYNKNSITDLSVISDYSSNKSKIINIDVIFNNSSVSRRSKKNILSKTMENSTGKIGTNVKSNYNHNYKKRK